MASKKLKIGKIEFYLIGASLILIGILIGGLQNQFTYIVKVALVALSLFLISKLFYNTFFREIEE